MTEEIIKVLDELKKLAPQFEEIAEHTVAYKLWTGVFVLTVAGAVFCVCCVLIRRALKKKDPEYGWLYDDLSLGVFIASLSVGFVMFILIIVNAIAVIKCLISPELVVFETVSRLVLK
jgi:K+-transporting ATPase A subunit